MPRRPKYQGFRIEKGFGNIFGGDTYKGKPIETRKTFTAWERISRRLRVKRTFKSIRRK